MVCVCGLALALSGAACSKKAGAPEGGTNATAVGATTGATTGATAGETTGATAGQTTGETTGAATPPAAPSTVKTLDVAAQDVLPMVKAVCDAEPEIKGKAIVCGKCPSPHYKDLAPDEASMTLTSATRADLLAGHKGDEVLLTFEGCAMSGANPGGAFVVGEQDGKWTSLQFLDGYGGYPTCSGVRNNGKDFVVCQGGAKTSTSAWVWLEKDGKLDAAHLGEGNIAAGHPYECDEGKTPADRDLTHIEGANAEAHGAPSFYLLTTNTFVTNKKRPLADDEDCEIEALAKKGVFTLKKTHAVELVAMTDKGTYQPVADFPKTTRTHKGVVYEGGK